MKRKMQYVCKSIFEEAEREQQTLLAIFRKFSSILKEIMTSTLGRHA